jgi:hypothetical protein
VEIDEAHHQILNSWSNATFWKVGLSEFSKVGDLCFYIRMFSALTMHNLGSR